MPSVATGQPSAVIPARGRIGVAPSPAAARARSAAISNSAAGRSVMPAGNRLLLALVAPLRDPVFLDAIDACAVPPMRRASAPDVGDMLAAHSAAARRIDDPVAVDQRRSPCSSSSGIARQSASIGSEGEGGGGRGGLDGGQRGEQREQRRGSCAAGAHPGTKRNACGPPPDPLARPPSRAMRSGGRVVEGARLESEYTSKAYRGFESLPLRHLVC